jgi:GT2 family glycosyltransferase
MATLTATNNFVKPASPAQTAAENAVSIVIVSWNAKRYLAECLESLQRQCGEVRPEVIVVDNASSDGSPELVASQFPHVRLIRNVENAGFARANNAGIALSTGEYVCLVNSDVRFVSNCFAPMLRYMQEHPEVALLGPKMLSAEGEVRRSTMRFPTLWNSYCRALGLDGIFRKSRIFGGQLMADFDHQTTRDAEVLNGWFWMARRSALEEVGLLDEQFFMYGEDIDWCYRFRQAGKRIIFFAGAEAIHYGGASSGNAPVRFYLEMYRAGWQFWHKHHGRMAQAGFLTSIGLHHILRTAGYSLLYLARPGLRAASGLKISRSLACLRWLGSVSFEGQKELNRA